MAELREVPTRIVIPNIFKLQGDADLVEFAGFNENREPIKMLEASYILLSAL